MSWCQLASALEEDRRSMITHVTDEKLSSSLEKGELFKSPQDQFDDPVI